jgi:hypothetical protein
MRASLGKSSLALNYLTSRFNRMKAGGGYARAATLPARGFAETSGM